GVSVWSGSLLSRLEECDRDLRAWSSVWNAGRVAQEFADEHHCPRLGRRLVGLVELRGLEVDRRFGIWLRPDIPPESRAVRKLLRARTHVGEIPLDSTRIVRPKSGRITGN